MKKIKKSLIAIAALSLLSGVGLAACEKGGTEPVTPVGPVETTKYTITFINWDDSVIESKEVEAGTVPTCSITPTRPDSNGYTYQFKEWDSAVVAANGDKTYKAVYTKTPIAEKYSVRVTAPNGVNYSLNKTEAEEGEEIVLTIDSVNAGISIKNVTFNNKTVTGSNNQYKYTMGAGSVVIKISVSVEGDIVIEGDLAASFAKEESGLYAARNIEVPGNGTDVKFSVVIKSGGEETKLKALDLDDTRSFGQVSAMNGGENIFSVASGATYDFFYDETDSEAPFYIQRVGVSQLPSNAKQLENLLITNRAIRSEYPMNPGDMVSVYYKVKDQTTEDVVWEEYNWKLYENNTAFGTVTDLFDDDADTRYVYKQYDEENELYTVVDTYAYKYGNLILNNDPYRLEYNKFGANSGRLAVIDGDDYGYRFSINNKKALRNVKTSAHQPAHLLEQEIYYCYRDSMEVDDDVTNYSLDISSVAGDDGAFTTTITSWREHGYTGSIGASNVVEAFTYNATLEFNKRGELTSINYVEKYYAETEWNFVNHTANLGQKGKTLKSIDGEFAYGEPYSGTPAFGDFNLNDYFVSSFNNLQFYNENAKDEEAKSSGKSVVGIENDIYIESLEGDFSKYITHDDFYSPATALDLWQYGPTATSDDSVIRKEPNDTYYQYTAVDLGSADVTFSSHVPGVGATEVVNIEVRSVAKARDFWLDYTDHSEGVDSDCLTSSEKATVIAGDTYKFRIRVTADNGIGVSESAALRYTAVSSDESLLRIISVSNSPYLEIDVSSEAACALTNKKDVGVTIQADYADWIVETENETKFVITILPCDTNPLGTWTSTSPNYPATSLIFTDNAYEGEVKKGYEGAKKGYIKDIVYDDTGAIYSTDYYYFYYVYISGKVKAELYQVSFGVNNEGYTTNPDKYTFEIEYDYINDQYGVFVAIGEYDSEMEETTYDVMIGFYDINVPENTDYLYFERDLA